MKKYSYETKIKAVIDVLEKGKSKNSVAKSIGCCCADIRKWVRLYEYHGADGLIIKNKTYSGDFKVYVVEYMHTHHLSSPETAAYFGIPSKDSVVTWERIYNKEGAEVLYRENRGRKKSMNPNKINNKIKNSDVKNQSKEELISEVQRLRMENAYLKKLNALVQEREISEKKIK